MPTLLAKAIFGFSGISVGDACAVCPAVVVPGMVSRPTRLAIQAAHGSIRQIAKEFGVNPKTVIKWRSVPTGVAGLQPSTSGWHRTSAEMRIVRFRVTSALALDDCLYASQVAFPSLTRSSMYRVLRRQGVARVVGLSVYKYISSLDPHDRLGVCSMYVTEAKAPSGSYVVHCAVDHATKLTLMRAYEEQAGSAEDFIQRVHKVFPFPLRTILQLEGDQDLFGAPAITLDTTQCGVKVVRLLEPALADTCMAGAALPEVAHPTIAEIRQRIASFLETFNFQRKIMQLGGLRPAEALDRVCGVGSAELLRNHFDQQIMRQ